MNRPRIGVFGSAFDPPTLGHQDVLQQVSHHFDLILLVPSASHAFHKRSLPFRTRVEMLHIFAASAVVDCDLEVCDLEAQLLESNPGKPVYTFDLLEALEQSHHNPVELSFIRGPDNAHPDVWNKFYKAAEIEQRWAILTASERLKIRSSTVRAIIESPNAADEKHSLDDFLLPSVAAFIQQCHLYKGHV